MPDADIETFLRLAAEKGDITEMMRRKNYELLCELERDHIRLETPRGNE